MAMIEHVIDSEIPGKVFIEFITHMKIKNGISTYISIVNAGRPFKGIHITPIEGK
jgi:hypothetical protein